MSFAQNLQYLLDLNDMSNYSLAQAMGGVSQSSVANWLGGGTKPSKKMQEKLSCVFGVTVDELMGDATPDAKPIDRSAKIYPPEVMALAEKVNALDEHGKEVVEAVLAVESKRIGTEYNAPQIVYQAPVVKRIPLMRDFAAGSGVTADVAWEEVEVPVDNLAEFAIKVNGDSMEPYFPDGSIAYGIRRMPHDREIVAIMVDGENFIKQFSQDSYGNLYLFSLNRDRKDIKVSHSAERYVKIWGTILTEHVFRYLPIDFNDEDIPH